MQFCRGPEYMVDLSSHRIDAMRRTSDTSGYGRSDSIMPDRVSAPPLAAPAKRETSERPSGEIRDSSAEIGQLRASIRALAPMLDFKDEPAHFRTLLERRAK